MNKKVWKEINKLTLQFQNKEITKKYYLESLDKIKLLINK